MEADAGKVWSIVRNYATFTACISVCTFCIFTPLGCSDNISKLPVLTFSFLFSLSSCFLKDLLQRLIKLLSVHFRSVYHPF